MSRKRNVWKGLMVGIAIAFFLGWTITSLIAWCPSGKRAPRARAPQPQPTTPPGTPAPSPNPNPTPTPPGGGGGTTPGNPSDTAPTAPPSTPRPGTGSTQPSEWGGPALSRPLQGTGIAPYFWDSLFDNPTLTASILPMWENWWMRNRMHYLSFKEPITWFETSAAGETVPVATGLRKQVFEVLTNCMKNEKSPVVRATAALALGKFRDKFASNALKDSFKNDKDFDVKNVSGLSLGILGEDSVVNELKMVLSDKQESSKFGTISRAYAALSLGYINNKESIDVLKEVVSNNKANKEILCAALLALGNSEDKSLVPFIADVLNNTGRDEFVRAYAALALGRIKDTSALPSLKKASKDPKDNVRASVAIALGLIKSPDSKDDLASLMKDKTPAVRAYAIMALAQLGDKSFASAFLQTIKKADYFTAGICALALGILQDETAKPELRKIVEKKNNLTVYNAAILALGLLKDKEAVPLLFKIIEKNETDTVAWPYAIQALGMIGDERAIPVLEEVFKKAQKRYDLASNAYNTITISLAMLGKRKEVLTSLYKQLDDKTILPDIKWRILHGIGYIGDKTSIEPLINFYKQEDNEWTRMYAVFALGLILDKDKINPLYKITSDNNFNIWLRIIDHIAISKPD